jgi:hypothetical protein
MTILDRPHWLWALVHLAVVILFSIVSASAYAQPASGTESAGPPAADSADVSIPIPPQPECLAKTGNWSDPERWAWQQICARERIDFDKRYGKQTAAGNLDSLKSDPARLLSASFFRELFENSQLSPFSQNAAIDVTGAYIPTIRLTDTTIGSLRLFKSKVDGGISITNATISRTLTISNSSIDDLEISRTKGGDINIANSTITTFHGLLLNVGRLSLVGSKIDDFQLDISRLSAQLAILTGTFGSIVLDDIKSDGLFVRPAGLRTLRVSDYVDSGLFYLEVSRWTAKSTMKISTMTTGSFLLRGESIPAEMSITGISFSGANWGSDPLQFLKANTPYNPALYANLATSYAQAGQPDIANAILIEKQNAEFSNTSSWIDKTYLFVIWLLADYGYRPELGLLWIAGFVIVSAMIFKTGRNRIKEGNPPDNWLIFAFDSAIPGIQLNKDHADIQFSGWRQGFLYLLRFLSAVVVVLVLEMMKKSFEGL